MITPRIAADNPAPSLKSAELKIVRAREHFAALVALAGAYRTSPYQIVREVDAVARMVNYVLKLPDPPIQLAVVVGDSIHNLRTALDHLVYQLVLVNGHTPTKLNMFPICDSPDMFVKALKRGRLSGVCEKAVNVIEKVQPYQAATHRPLWVLSELENTDKHRTLLVASGAVSTHEITLLDASTKKVRGTMQWSNSLVPSRHNSPLFGCGLDSGSPYVNVETHHEGAACELVFDESATQGIIVRDIDQMIDLVEKTVMPLFVSFF